MRCGRRACKKPEGDAEPFDAPDSSRAIVLMFKLAVRPTSECAGGSLFALGGVVP